MKEVLKMTNANDYIAFIESGSADTLCRAIIRKNAFRTIRRKDGTMSVITHDLAQEIVNSFFRHELYADCMQELCATIWEHREHIYATLYVDSVRTADIITEKSVRLTSGGRTRTLTITDTQTVENGRYKLHYLDVDEEGKSETLGAIWHCIAQYFNRHAQREYKHLWVDETDEDGNVCYVTADRHAQRELEDCETYATIMAVLDTRQKQVLRMRLDGYSVQEIADAYGVTRRTVCNWQRSIYNTCKDIVDVMRADVAICHRLDQDARLDVSRHTYNTLDATVL